MKDIMVRDKENGRQYNSGGRSNQKRNYHKDGGDGDWKREKYHFDRKEKRRREKAKEKEAFLKDFDKTFNSSLNQAIERGVYELQQNNPGLSHFGGYLDKYTKRYDIEDTAKGLSLKYLNPDEKKTLSKGELISRASYIVDEIQKYVAAGDMLTEEGKKKILTGHLEFKDKEKPPGLKGVFHSIFHKPRTDGQKALNKKFDTFEDFAAIVESGNYNVPEFDKLANELKRMRLYDASVEVLREGGIIKPEEYRDFKGEVIHKTNTGGKQIKSTLEHKLKGDESEEGTKKNKSIDGYVFAREEQRMAAAILSFFGFGLILAKSPGITGNAIRASEIFSNTGSILGAGIFVTGLILFFIFRRKKKYKYK